MILFAQHCKYSAINKNDRIAVVFVYGVCKTDRADQRFP